MSSLLKRKRGSNGSNIRQPEDRITNLPSSLTTKILSCLPTKDAVATSVLSTKWKRSWTSVTSLDFNISSTSFGYFRCDSLFFKKVRSFINRVLLLRDKSCLHRFRLSWYRDCDDSLFNAWLIDAVHCNVQELDIYQVYIKHPTRLPSDIFQCDTLVVLKINGVGSCVGKLTCACLPSLKTLHIDGIQFSHDDSISNLLSGCHVLEELRLRNCIGKDIKVVNISTHVLKRLTISYLPYNYWVESDTNINYQIVIDTPVLESFTFDDFRFLGKVYVVNNMNHLIRAAITFDSCHMDQYLGVYPKTVKDFLKAISHVENLVLSWDLMKIISSCNIVLPNFGNLTYLELNTAGDPGWTYLPKLLINSPCLETLYLKQENGEIEKKDLDKSPFDYVPSCFLFNLKVIDIESFEFCEGEMEVVEYILKNAKVLEKLTLHYHMHRSDPVEDHAEFFKELLSFQRASTICKVVVPGL